MAVSSTIQNFLRVAGERDLARDNLYRILRFNAKNLTLSEDDLMYCKGGRLPGRETPTNAVKYMGVDFHYTQSTVKYTGCDDYELEFYLDANSELQKKFERASREAFNDVSTTGDWRFPTADNTVVLAQLDTNLDVIDYVTLYGVCFKKIDNVDFGMAEKDGKHVTIKVHISFHYYRRSDGSSEHVFAGV